METFIAMMVLAVVGAVVDLIQTNDTNQANAEQAQLNRNAQARENALNREFNSQEAEKDREFQAQMANTDVIRQFKQYEQLGVNPLMAVVGGSGSPVPSGAHASYGSGISGALPSMIKSMAGSQLGGLSAQVAQAQLLDAQKENIEADTALKNAEANKKTTETTGVELDNEFKQRVMDAKVEGQKLANDLTRQQSRKIDSEIDNLAHDSFLKAQQASTEEERQKYFESASILNRANAYKVTVMLPYQQALAEAETAAQKAAAGLAQVQAAYQQGLIDNSYIDNLCKKVAAEAGLSEDAKAIADIKAGIRTGDWSGDPVSKFIAQNVLTPLANIIDNYNPLTNALSGLVTK